MTTATELELEQEPRRAELSAEATSKTLNGFDELAIAGAFGSDVTVLRDAPLMFLRALAFIDLRRKGLKDAEAYVAAMTILSVDLADYFPADPPDLEEDPGTPEGKDSTPRD